MKEIVIKSAAPQGFISQLQVCLNGKLKEDCAERTLSFDNEMVKGTLKTIRFGRGVSLMSCDITLSEETKVVIDTPDASHLEFIFISEGSFKYSEHSSRPYIGLEQFQNIIISPKRKTQKSFLFPEGKNLKINFIRIVRNEYLKKNNYLNQLLLSLFKDNKGDKDYQHEGSFSLKIADEVKHLNSVQDNGMLKTLAMEGRLYLILSMQLMEYHHFKEKINLPESLSKADISKMQQLTDYILDHISETISINVLSCVSGLSPKKLQLGFKVVYSKTVNEYIRQLKLEISRDYLKNTELSVSEIVYSIGIKSRSYFSKIFFETYSILPTDYRKQLRKNNSYAILD